MRTFEGVAGFAFTVDLPPADDRGSTDSITCLGRWNMKLPDQHILWDRYSLNLVHLRDCAALTPAAKESPDKTHEITVFAINPDFPEEAFQEGGISILEPLNHVCQFAVNSDSEAYRIAEIMVQKLVDGEELVEPSGIRNAREHFKESVENLI